MKLIITQFFASMLQIFLLGLNTIFFIDKNIIGIGIVSIGITAMWMVSVNGVMCGWKSRIAIIAGSCIGAMLSIPIHDFMKG